MGAERASAWSAASGVGAVGPSRPRILVCGPSRGCQTLRAALQVEAEGGHWAVVVPGLWEAPPPRDPASRPQTKGPGQGQ